MEQAANPNVQWWRGAVIYQIYPRSFADSNADGVGDLNGISAHLDYVASLGVDAIWVSPFFKSPMKDFGYDVSDYRDVDPLFGNLDDFDRMLAKAHALGLKVIIDQVLSHTSDQHAWFKESRQSKTNPKADWYVWADPQADGSAPNNWLSVFGGPSWRWDTRRCQYYLHNFLYNQPDVNFHNPEVQDAVLGEIEFWLKRGVDGFRFDACNYHFHDRQLRNNPPATKRDTASVSAENPYGYQQHKYDKSQPENLAFLQRIRKLLDQYGAAMSVGEVGDDESISLMAQYTGGNDKLNMAYSFNLLTADFSAAHIRKQVEDLESQLNDGWGCWTTGNHDSVRVVSRWGKDTQHPRFAPTILAMLVSLRGSSCLYQGEELGLPEAQLTFEQLQDPYGIAMWPEFKGRDGCRTPMPWHKDQLNAGFSPTEPWLPVASTHVPLAVDAQEGKDTSTLAAYRRILHWRKTQPTLLLGDISFLQADEPVLAFTRKHAGQTLVAVFNLSEQPQTFTLPFAVDDLAGHGLEGATRTGVTLQLDAWAGWYGTAQ
ncbi:alpha-glucosidase family protein [Amantichitinum ursilacus]|uniref:Oligo-1,6-glucosidase n=1 Tax=Amantichitinum ursilacus TaxID=857265 RepID=A0A0N0XJN2_9NEIS|nr:alpha-glucosidase family protein [Amantichitinum ursilacus]KPC52325.1 Oligo-1,6-glucosidase [Amantichitinum ursilacus]